MDYEEIFREARTFPRFLETVEHQRDLWNHQLRAVRLDPSTLGRAAALTVPWRLLAIAEDWCTDCLHILPAVVHLIGGAPTLELKVVGREEVPGLMDRHLTKGARSIPVVVILDPRGQPVGQWGPRPRDLQQWFETEGRNLPAEARHRALRRWYASDRGRAPAKELVELLEKLEQDFLR